MWRRRRRVVVQITKKIPRNERGSCHDEEKRISSKVGMSSRNSRFQILNLHPLILAFNSKDKITTRIK
ncbi:unnamed protein product [Lupinus luteus]|uniref:Uncharacterized protein n=1 Tax=Lupinus luteus TaxID=3873 RepID=A0AAV1VZJ0_LUPLU